MNRKLFVKWLVEVRGLKESVAKNRTSSCASIEKVYGSLEEHYYLDSCYSLLVQLRYSKADEREKLPAKHLIHIGGNVYNVSATLRQSLNRYVEFMNDKTN